MPESCVDRLVDAYKSREESLSEGTAGLHACEICWPDGDSGEEPPFNVVWWRTKQLELSGHGHHLVRLGDTVYLCPRLILHYILDHNYQPPPEFLQAVSEGTFLTKDDLVLSSGTYEEFIGDS